MNGNTTTVIGLFDEPEALLRAAEKARDAGWRRWDCHSPYPVHGLDKAMGLKESFIPWLTLSAGFFGAAFAKAMQWYMSDYDFPLIVGGKPLFSLPAFVPVTFELFVLLGALTTFASIIILCRTLRWSSPLRRVGAMGAVTSDHFAIALEALDAAGEPFSQEAARRLLEESGCGDIRVAGPETRRGNWTNRTDRTDGTDNTKA